MKKYYTEEELIDKFEKLSNKKKVEILETSLSLMQQANWRSREYCIILSMDYDICEDTDRYVKNKL